MKNNVQFQAKMSVVSDNGMHRSPTYTLAPLFTAMHFHGGRREGQ